MSFAVSTCFTPHALARRNNTRNNRRAITKKLSENPNPRLKSRTSTSRDFPPLPLSSVSGGDASTYTRLPPKEDFVLSPFDSKYQSSTEFKLSDSKIPNEKLSNNRLETQNDGLSSEDEIFDEKSRFDYGKFELFEVNSDSEDYDDDDDDDDEVLGFKRDGSENVFDGEGVEGEKEKEKGVPAVMRCFDRAKIYVKAGDGGSGVVAFRREKFVPLGGPSGGDGGRGGNVYLEVDGSMNSLLPFRQSIHFRAGRGRHGQGRNQNGAKGEDVVVKVPPGTVIREAAEDDGVQGELLLELLHPGQRALLLPGGKGGRGNASFKSGTNKVPKIAENGEEGAEM